MDLYHSGVGHDDNPPGRGSGRYAWGSGEVPYQHMFNFLSEVRRLKKLGIKERDIAKTLLGDDATSATLRAEIAINDKELRKIKYSKAVELYDKYNGNVSAVARELTKIDPTGKKWNESSVRSLLDPTISERNSKYQNTADFLKKKVSELGIIDVGESTEISMGVTQNTKDIAIAMLEKEGYTKNNIFVKQTGGSGGNKYTSTLVLAPPGMTYDEVVKKVRAGEMGIIQDYTPDNGKTWWVPEKPASIDSSRVYIRYAEDGGKNMDGVIELRKGVEDISLGGANYAQVRVAVDDTHYMKGMAIYSDDIPSGYDVVYNTNKHVGTPPLGQGDNTVLKQMKSDPENPFGANLKSPTIGEDGILTAAGQRHYVDENGEDRLSPINKLREEGDWDSWSRTVSSQFLSKQPIKIIKQQLDISIADKQVELESIQSLTNPVIKQRLLNDFAGKCESDAADLRAVGFKSQSYQVLLPVPGLKDNECYDTNYADGETLALVRFPHAGLFEIPIVKNNTKSKAAKSVMENASDAIGINNKVAEQLSGADFDGDTVIAIPIGSSNLGIQSMKPIKELVNFDAKEIYKLPESAPKMTDLTKQILMGQTTNLITDMTAAGAELPEIVRAVKHSMVVIDAQKHHLDYKQSAEDNRINELKQKYQARVNPETGRVSTGAATIFSRASAGKDVPKFREITATWKMTPEELEKWNRGDKVYRQTGEVGIKKITDPAKMTADELKLYHAGKSVWRETGKLRTQKMQTMYTVDDAMDLVRDKNNEKEVAYANYANELKDLARTARIEARAIKPVPKSAAAATTYVKEVASLNSKLTIANSNAPLERAARALAGAMATQEIKANPDMDAEHRKRAEGRALVKARSIVGSKKTPITITDSEWEAIQANAISTEKLKKILLNTDIESVKRRATPKNDGSRGLSNAQISLLLSMASNGNYTQKDIADRLGISVSTVSKYLKSH